MESLVSGVHIRGELLYCNFSTMGGGEFLNRIEIKPTTGLYRGIILIPHNTSELTHKNVSRALTCTGEVLMVK